ncbi:MAG: protein translocase subunit SecD [Dehalococcoidia bacterium]|nr:protein translocase subunit SecD [Dehalococcoidia bacterium]
MPSRGRWLPVLGILLLAAAALYFVWPGDPSRVLPSAIPWPRGHGISIGGFERRDLRLGLDLQGGTRLLLAGKLPEGEECTADAVEGTIRVLRKRVDASGVAEAEITGQGTCNIAVQLPGLTPDQARSLLGRTALLRFCQQAAITQPVSGEPCDAQGQWAQAYGTADGRPLALKGNYLKPNAFVQTDQLGNPAVAFEFQGDGGRLFQQITTRLLQLPLGIFLDDELISAPIVSSVISDRGVITGVTLERAREMVIQLNSGALPLTLTVLQEQTVDATLGEDSVRRSVLAGEIGFLLVVLFMVLYYRLPGVLASIALGVYAIVTIAVFKLIPVTLTLAGIGAFVLSVGMAVDANILIFERMKEELRASRSYIAAIDAGFRRAWPSIRDSNVATLITCLILFVLGGGIELPLLGAFDAPLVQGFAVTLAIGVGMSMFSAITVTRALLRLLVGTRLARRYDWLGGSARAATGSAPAGDGS